MPDPAVTRRAALGAAALAPLTSPAASLAAPGAPGDPAVAADLARYASFGVKASGGPADAACGAWMEAELTGLGFTVERQGFEAPFFESEAAALALASATVSLTPQAPVRATGPEGVTAPLHLWGPGSEAAARGSLAVIVLPFRRWSSLATPEAARPLRAALDAGAAGLILVTTGPSGEALSLNAPADAPPPPAPVALLAPKDAPPVIAAAARGETARLTLTGAGGHRPAFNLIARRGSGRSRRLVVSTPRSGWTIAAGERGPGVAVWLALARWAVRAGLDADLLFLATSGHEYDNVGGRLFLASPLAPAPDGTALWVHLGANLAARDWHDLGPALLPLPSADPQRYMVASDPLLPAVRRAFAGQPGLEAPYSAAAGADGELKEILAAGHRSVCGVFGGHRFHHAPGDDLRCVTPAPVAAAAESFKAVIRDALRA